MKGRIPVPMELKLLRGTRRRSSGNQDEPITTAGIPPKPKGLTRIESQYWKSLVKHLMQRRTLHSGMGSILELACSYHAQYRKNREACKVSSVYETRSREGAIVWKEKPEVAIMRQGMKGLLGCLEQMGLTPASAARVRPLPLAKKKETNGIESYFDGPPTNPSA